MVYDNSESSAQTERRSKKHQRLLDRQGVINARPILAFRVRQRDGALSDFDILKVMNSFERSMLSIGLDLDRENQCLVYDLCSQIINVLVEDISNDGIVDVEDVQVQIEMTLVLNRHVELAKAYSENVSFIAKD